MVRNLDLLDRYIPGNFAGRITLFKSHVRPLFKSHNPERQWAKLASDGVTVYTLPGNHQSILEAPSVTRLAEYLQAELRSASTLPISAQV